MITISWNTCNKLNKDIKLHNDNCSSIEQIKPKNKQKSNCQHYKEFLNENEAKKWCKKNFPNLNIQKCKKCW